MTRVDNELGLAVDLGTTNLSVRLLDATRGRDLGTSLLPNPQAPFGADVMTRLLRAQDPVRARELQGLAIAAIGREASRLCGRIEAPTQAIGRVAVVANSVMLALLTGTGLGRLLDPTLWMSLTPPTEVPTAQLRHAWGLAADASVEVVPALGGFVGSDLFAGILHTYLTDSPRPGMLIDFGTNSEVAVWDGSRLLVTSAAGGPAFEGVGIGCGVPAVPGAVYKVETGPTGAWRYHTLDDAGPVGICASGLVDMLALLLAEGRLSPSGRLRPPATTSAELPGSGFAVSNGDIDLLQRAKAAIGAGCRVLCGMVGLDPAELDVVHVAGAFGSFLDVEHAQAIGLLPPTARASVLACGNAALAGCAELLVGPDAAQRAARVRSLAETVNLVASTDFESLFFDHLMLRPIPAA